jgi:N-carbamoylputrescine amidase
MKWKSTVFITILQPWSMPTGPIWENSERCTFPTPGRGSGKNFISSREIWYAKIGIYICYDRHFPECARVLALKGAEILFNPSATTSGKSQYLWQLEQPAQAVANGVFIGANNRIGLEKPWEFGEFYGSSYFVDPRGQILVQGSEGKDEVVMADLDLEQIREVRDGWQFFRDLRPDQYTELTETKGKYR